MRNRKLWVAAALLAAFALVGMSVAADSTGKNCGNGKTAVSDKQPAADGKQAGDRGGFQGRGRGGPGGFRGLSVDQIVERIMSFDKNKDGKITKDELPERLQNLIEKGDTNKDGALDKDEIKALATKIQQEGLGGFGGFGRFGGRGGPPGGFGPGNRAERALNDLNITDTKKKEAATAAVKAHEETVKKLMELARADLLLKMKDLLSADEYKKFKEELERQPGPPGPRTQ
jgi:hypothetical protein